MKLASRYLIPLELFLAACLISWGLSGWFGDGSLWRALSMSGQNNEWGTVMVAVGFAQFAAASIEWLVGRHWCSRILLTNASTRACCSALATIVWFYACFKIVTLPGMDMVVALWTQAPIGALFSAWCFVGNMRVRTVLNPDIDTRQLEQTLLIDRRRYERF